MKLRIAFGVVVLSVIALLGFINSNQNYIFPAYAADNEQRFVFIAQVPSNGMHFTGLSATVLYPAQGCSTNFQVWDVTESRSSQALVLGEYTDHVHDDTLDFTVPAGHVAGIEMFTDQTCTEDGMGFNVEALYQ